MTSLPTDERCQRHGTFLEAADIGKRGGVAGTSPSWGRITGAISIHVERWPPNERSSKTFNVDQWALEIGSDTRGLQAAIEAHAAVLGIASPFR